MTDPKYIADRNQAAFAHERDDNNYMRGSAQGIHIKAFSDGADWGYSRANSELRAEIEELDKSTSDLYCQQKERHKLQMEKMKAALDVAVKALEFYSILRQDPPDGSLAINSLNKIKTLIGETGDK